MIKLFTDPALTTSPTLAIFIGRHEWYIWKTDRKWHKLYNRNDFYVKGQPRP